MDDSIEATDVPEPEWSESDVKELCTQVKPMLAESDGVHYRRRIDKLKWDEIKIGHFSSEECKEKFRHLCDLAAKHVTTNMLLSIIEKNPMAYFRTHEKKPLTPYMRYFMDCRGKYREKYQGMSVGDISRKVSEKWKNLSESKKAKYVEEYRSEMAEYRTRHENGSSGMKTNPAELFVQAKLDTKLHLRPDADVNEIRRQLWEKFHTLSDRKKRKWMEKADLIDEENKSKAVAKKKTAGQKRKRNLQSKFNEPVKPHLSAYTIFSSEKLKALVNMPLAERMRQVSEMWKSQPLAEKSHYELLAAQNRRQYEFAMIQFKATLSMEELAEYERERVSNSKKGRKSDAAAQAAAAVVAAAAQNE